MRAEPVPEWGLSFLLVYRKPVFAVPRNRATASQFILPDQRQEESPEHSSRGFHVPISRVERMPVGSRPVAIHHTRSTFDYTEGKKKRRLILVKMNG